MPYLEHSDQTEVTKDSTFVPVENESQDEEKEEPPKPRRTTRGQPPERFSKMYAFGALSSHASGQLWYKQTTFIPCNINI